MITFKQRLLASAIPAITLLASAPAVAQDAPADEAGIGDIVVTAQRREQNIQDVALSVTAIGGEKLAASGIVDISKLDQLVPGLQLGQSGTDARPAIRGARTESVSVQQDPVIGFFVDGIYRSRTSQALAAFVDTDRVEVLRGPQGTLYGRNTFGGAINIISNAPTNELKVGANLTIGNYKQFRLDGFANLPISDTLFFRVSGAIDQHDGYVKNTFDRSNDIKDKKERYIRGQLRFEPSDAFDATIRASYWKQGGNGASDFGYYNAGTPIDPNGTAPFTYDEVVGASLRKVNPRAGAGGLPSDSSPYRFERDEKFDLDTEQTTVDFEANYDVGFANAKILVGYADFASSRTADGDLSILPSLFEVQIDEAKTFTQELQLASTGKGPLKWTIGAFNLRDKVLGLFLSDRIFATNALTNRPIIGTPAPAGSDFNSRAAIDTKALAFYGEATYSIMDAFRVTAGARWSRDKKDFERQTNSNYTVPIVFAAAPFRDDETFEKVTWRGGAEFDLSDDNLLYATVSTGFQSGGFNNSADAATGGASFDEQTVIAYEIGSKNSLLDGRMIANLSIYQNDFKNLLAQEFVNVGQTVLTISTNAGAARARGAELEVKIRAAKDVDFNAQIGINDAKFGRYFLQEPVSGQSVNLQGGRVPLSPKFTAGFGADYGYEFGTGGKLISQFNLNYSSSYSTNDVDYKFGRQKSYAKLDVSLTYEAPNSNFYVQAFGRNVTDKAVLNRTVRFNPKLKPQG
jgi:iron complex outermembrane recepter protein